MSEQPLCFRRMTLEDIDCVMKVENEVYQFPWTEQIFSDCIRVGYLCWMAARADTVVGHAVISITPGESHMLNLSIRKIDQGNGYGKQFIEFLIGVASENQAETMLLEVRPSNIPAINCYNSSGFNEIGCRKDYYPAPDGREDALLFARHIPPHTDALCS
jgi:ribosomal-protein-alanine N-acetyltransferase